MHTYTYVYIYIYICTLVLGMGEKQQRYSGPQTKAIAVARAPLHQNLNSGSLRVNGLTVLQFIAPNISVCLHF